MSVLKLVSNPPIARGVGQIAKATAQLAGLGVITARASLQCKYTTLPPDDPPLASQKLTDSGGQQ
ncbi:hypothetical protein [Sporisorium scitamineum]|uniref:Uncharacterized protein n=1 Tax=Sporisorium scitamineum TaxID=49012 RepID=A0A0F7S4M9_9BASI|nr:hypothetical protein [Sporisorium scitamineum]